MPEGYGRLALAQAHHETLWYNPIPPSWDLEKSQMFLAIRSGHDAAYVIDRLPALIRIAHDLESIRLQINRALPGLGVHATGQSAVPLPQLPNTVWCQLDQRGPWWRRILEARTLAVRIPLDIPVSTLELFTIREDRSTADKGK